MIKNSWEGDGNTDPIQPEELFTRLNSLHSSPYHKGRIVSSERARKVMELTGGF